MRTTFKISQIRKVGAIFVFVLTTLGPTFLFAEPYIAWVQRYNGPGNLVDQVSRLAIDSSGNVYITGRSDGIGTGSDFVTLKYSPHGNLLWEQRYNGPGNANDYASYMELDKAANVYIAGTSVGIGTSSDYTIIKYDSNGNQLWVSRYNISSSGDGMTDFTMDALGNSYIAGFHNVGGFNFIGVVAKFNSQGNYLWSVLRDGPSSWDVIEGIVVAPDGSIYIVGSSGLVPLTYFFEKLFHWSIVTPEFYKQLVVDKKGNIYIGNFSGNYVTRKYDSSSALIWERIYDGPASGSDRISEMTIDNEANVYVAGYSAGVGTGNDFATVKYDSTGNKVWVERYDGPADGSDILSGAAVDGNGNIYVTGGSVGNGTGSDFATIKYGSAGNQIWVHRYNGITNSEDGAHDIVANDDGYVWVTGGSAGDILTIKYSPAPILKGDLDENGVLALDDIVSLLNCIFLGSGSCSPAFADVNCDAFLTPADVVVLLLTFYASVPPPC